MEVSTHLEDDLTHSRYCQRRGIPLLPRSILDHRYRLPGRRRGAAHAPYGFALPAELDRSGERKRNVQGQAVGLVGQSVVSYKMHP